MTRTVLLGVVVAASLVVSLLGMPAVLVFVFSCAALIPLAAVMGDATEEISVSRGPVVGGLLNATFGNATELLVAVAAIRAGGPLLEMVKASITGSIIGNLLLVLGAAIVAGGLRRQTMSLNVKSAAVMTSMMMLAVVGLVVPAVFAAVRPRASGALLEGLSLAVAAVLMLVYVLGLVFSLGTHRQVFVPCTVSNERADGPSLPRVGQWGTAGPVLKLAGATALVALESEWLTGAMSVLVRSLHLSPVFLGAVVIAVVGNAAEHVVAIKMARGGQLDLAFQVACGSSTQIALFVAPLLVFVSLLLGRPLNLLFTAFEVIAIVLSVVIVSTIASDGETNWFEGAQLLGVYGILCIAFYCL